MRYLLLIYTNAENWEHPIFLRDPRFLALPQAERDELVRQTEALHKEIMSSGELVADAALAAPAAARSVRTRDGAPVSTDGPYVEAKEQLAGFVMVDCETPERAAEIASRFPDARFSAVEVRPVMDDLGQEM
ncbi:YciI family protein [Actinophytocola xanthii]|uniref:YCII-related domain-containing protein n=1 Tax=Actinophytocola xanthii TaxID=1912961 RepID=A0A1Q8CNR8_9PSEU|nr:YciI family protein [Actinophytocola xanthii]OLF15993.1 hypothetical protein BU204_19025 [Actinophytocola xanthii]